MSGWDVELLFARDARDRRALARDRESGLVRSVRRGVFVTAASVAELTPEEKHVVAVRAVAGISSRPLLFSHWTSGVVVGADVLRKMLAKVHATFQDPSARGLDRVVGHVFPVADDEIVEVRGLLFTNLGRTVVDIASSGTFTDGVVAADSALRKGTTLEELEAAVDRAGPRRAARKVRRVLDFADGDSGSAGESVSRVTMDRMGLRPVLQRKHFDHRGFIGKSDFSFPEVRAAGEFDGRIKFTDPRFAPNGAGEALWDEKVREDRMRAVTDGFGRWGWPEAFEERRLAPVLRAAGVPVPARF